jgi:hypothetical protein
MALNKDELIAAIKDLSESEKREVADILKVSVDDSVNKSRTEELKIQRDLAKEQYEILSRTARAVGDFETAREFDLQSLRKELIKSAEALNLSEEAMKDFNESLDGLARGETTALDRLEDFDSGLMKMAQTYGELAKRQNDYKEGMKQIGGDLDNVFGDRGLAGKLGIVESKANRTVKSMANLLAEVEMGKIPAEQFSAAMVDYLGKTFHYTRIASALFSTIYSNTMDVLKAFDSAQASIAAATGQGREFNDVLYESGRSGNLFGISMQETADAINTMVNQTSAFTNLNKNMQESIALSVSQMGKLGISTDDAATTFQNFNQALRITASESMEMQKELAMAGVEVGIGAAKITKDFNASLSTLMVYGRQSIDVFKGIAAAAKAAGVETSTLLNIAQRFDTFAGAAEGVGKLNALLGTQLSTTEMLLATEDERIKMLIQSVQAQGVAFQDMDRFTQKAIANAAGITDMAEANRIFGMSLMEYEENERRLKASTDAQKKFEEAVASTVKLTDKLKILGAELITALQPAFEILTAVADTMIDFLKDMDTGTKNAIVGIVGLGAAFLTIAPLLSAGSTFLAGMASIPTMISGIGLATAGALRAIAGAVTGSGGVAGLILAGLLGSAIAIVASISAMSQASSEAAKAKAESATAMAKLGQTSTETLTSLDNIANADFSKAILGMKEVAKAANEMGQDVKVRSTIENLALVTAGQAKDMSGNVISASATNITTKVENIFSGMKMTVVVDGYEIDGVVAGATANNEET